MMKRLMLVGILASSSVMASNASVDALAKLLQAQPEQLIALYEGKFADINATAVDVWQASTAGMTEELKLMVVKEALAGIASNTSTTAVPAKLQAAGITNDQVWAAAKLLAWTIVGCTAAALIVYAGVQYYSNKRSLNHIFGSAFNPAGIQAVLNNAAGMLAPMVSNASSENVRVMVDSMMSKLKSFK